MLRELGSWDPDLWNPGLWDWDPDMWDSDYWMNSTREAYNATMSGCFGHSVMPGPDPWTACSLTPSRDRIVASTGINAMIITLMTWLYTLVPCFCVFIQTKKVYGSKKPSEKPKRLTALRRGTRSLASKIAVSEILGKEWHSTEMPTGVKQKVHQLGSKEAVIGGDRISKHALCHLRAAPLAQYPALQQLDPPQHQNDDASEPHTVDNADQWNSALEDPNEHSFDGGHGSWQPDQVSDVWEQRYDTSIRFLYGECEQVHSASEGEITWGKERETAHNAFLPPESLPLSALSRSSQLQGELSLDEPRAILEPSSPDKPERDQVTDSSTRSTNSNSTSLSEVSFSDLKESSILEDLMQGELQYTTMDVIGELSQRILGACLDHGDSSVNHQRTPSPSESRRSSSRPSAGQSRRTSHRTTPLRRSLQEASQRSEDDENNEGDECLAESGPPDSLGPETVKLFACPYSKFDPQRYSTQNLQEKRYSNCASSYLRDISRLKQHLYRVHALPKHYCLRCYNRFQSQQHLGNHVRQRSPCGIRAEPLYQERMTEEQYKGVHRRVVRGNPEETWFTIFEILFPRAPRPSSPYVSTNDPTSLAHFVGLFRAVGPAVIFEFMRDRREQVGGSLQLELSTQMLIDEAFEMTAPHYLNRMTSNAQGHTLDSGATVDSMNHLLTVDPTDSSATRLMYSQTRRGSEAVGQQPFSFDPLLTTGPEQHYYDANNTQPGQSPPDFDLEAYELNENPARIQYEHRGQFDFAFEPSEVNAGFENYAMVMGAQQESMGSALPALPATWGALPMEL